MNPIIVFCIALGLILLLTARLRLHPFLSLITASLLVGLLTGETRGAVDAISTGMGKVFTQFAIVITAGSIIGTILHRTGGTALMAKDMIRISNKPLLSLNLLGFLFSVPLMCCILAYVIFIPVAREVSDKLGLSRSMAATALGLGTLASFNMLYPSPVVYPVMMELGLVRTEVIIASFLMALIVSIIGYLYAVKCCSFRDDEGRGTEGHDMKEQKPQDEVQPLPGRIPAYAPLIVPVILIIAGIFIPIPPLDIIGIPAVALLIGVALAILLSLKDFTPAQLREWIEKGIRRSGVVLLDMCGGGALGATLALTGVGQAIGNTLLASSIPALLIPFILTAAIQSVQGSRVVTMLVSFSLILPVMPQIGLPAEIVFFSMISGTLLISHFNDPFFWIFGDLADMKPAQILRTYTAGGAVMGISSMILTAAMYFIFY